MKKTYTLRFRRSLMKRVKAVAESDGTTATAVIEEAAFRYLGLEKGERHVREDIRQP